MDDRDMTGLGAALAALALAIAGWMIPPPRAEAPPSVTVRTAHDDGLDRWLERLTEPGQQLARSN